MSLDRPEGYHVVTPRSWHRVPLEPVERTRSSIAALVGRQLEGDDRPAERRALVQELEDLAARSRANGGVELYLSQMQAGGLTVAASLVVSYLAGDGQGVGPEALLDLARGLGADDGVTVESCDVEHLPQVGDTVRRATSRVQTDTGVIDGEEQSVTSYSVGVDYLVPVPASGGAILLLSFSTPLVAAQEALTDLFDTIAATVRWQ